MIKLTRKKVVILSLFIIISFPFNLFANEYLYVLCPASNNIFQAAVTKSFSGIPKVEALAQPTVDSGGVGPGYTDRLDSTYYIANSKSNSSTQFSIDKDTGQLSLVRGETLNLTEIAVNPFNTWRTPNNKFAFITGTDTNSIAMVKIDPKSHVLSVNKTADFPESKINDKGVRTKHLIIYQPDPNKNKIYAYVDGSETNSITIYDVDQNKGEMYARDETVSTNGNGPRNNKIIKKGNNHYLYVVNENSNNISAFQILDDGSLKFIDLFSTGVGPIFIVAKDNKYLYVTNQNDNSISAYQIQDDGTLLGITNLKTMNNKFKTSGVSPFIPNLTDDLIFVPNRSTNTVDVFQILFDGTLNRVQTVNLNDYSCYDSFIASVVTF